MKLRGTRYASWGKRAVLNWSEFASRREWRLAAYNPLLFAFYHVVARDNAPGVISAVLDTFPDAHTYLDVGAGSGAFSAEARRRGVYVTACEHSPFGRTIAKLQGVDARPFDLERHPPAKVGVADLALCLEVAEHLPPEMAPGLVRFLVSRAPRIVFSAAHPGQGGTGHLNEQPKEYWIRQFEEAGASFDPDASRRLSQSLRRHRQTKPWYRDNALAFRARPTY